MAEQLHVVFAANEAYGPYCAAAIRSVFRSTRVPARVVAHVLTTGFTRFTADMVARAAYENGGGAEIHPIDSGRTDRLPTQAHISTDTYSRLLAADLLPHVDRFVYLDCDLVMLDDIAALHGIPLNGFPVGGVNHHNSSIGSQFAERFGVASSDAPYINAGVLVVDAAAWRKNGIGKCLLDWMIANSAKLEFSDQDAVNHFFRSRIALMPDRWNVEARHYAEVYNGTAMNSALRAAMRNPAVIHYTGPVKPWSFDSHVPHRGRYLEHLDAVHRDAGLPRIRRTRGIRNALAVGVGAMRFRLGRVRQRITGQKPA